MDFAYSEKDENFRAELRGWLDEELPKFLAEWSSDDDDDAADHDGGSGVMRQMERRRAWQRKLNEGRWAAITWPEEWGGRDASVTESMIYSEEMARYRTPGIYNANGLWQIGPMIIQWGTDDQKNRWIPNILNADDHWCQGFTEPEAGSDLANLRTTAVADGDEYVLNGQKIWISSAHIAKWGLFLVRTDPTAIERDAKHEGITALIIDLEVDGVDIRPIRDIAGEEMFCEVFFDDARVPVEYRLGGEGEGWQVAMGTLGHERVGTAGLAISMRQDLQAIPGQGGEPRGARRPRDPRTDRPGAHRRGVHAAAQLPGALTHPQEREALARGAAGQAPVEPSRPDHRRAGRRPAGTGGDDGPGRARRRRRRQVEPPPRLPALHLDRRRHHRGPEEHHRRPRHQTPAETTRPCVCIWWRNPPPNAHTGTQRRRSTMVALAWPPPSHMVWKP